MYSPWKMLDLCATIKSSKARLGLMSVDIDKLQSEIESLKRNEEEIPTMKYRI